MSGHTVPIVPGRPEFEESCRECGQKLSKTKLGRRLALLGLGFRGASERYGIRRALLCRLSMGGVIARGTEAEVEAACKEVGLALEDVENPWPVPQSRNCRHARERRCPGCEGSVPTVDLPGLVITFEMCECGAVPHAHLVERIHHRGCFEFGVVR